jgi:uncharacterized membrane protein
MGAGHDHTTRRDTLGDLPARQRRTIIATTVATILVVAAGAVTLLAGDSSSRTAVNEIPGIVTDQARAEIVSRTLEQCGTDRCVTVHAEIVDTDAQGTLADLGTVGAGTPLGRADIGTRIVVTESGGAWFFVDIERRPALYAMFAAFAVIVTLLGRSRGLRSLAALAVSLITLTAIAIPSILDGHDPLYVCLVAAGLIAVTGSLITLGPTPVACVATTGTLGALLVAWVSAETFTAAAQLTGVVGDNVATLTAIAPGVDLRGLFLGGVILGALGALDDITVTQASTVAELDIAGGRQHSISALYKGAMRVGRDHVGAAVNTLALAYIGGALPLFVLYAATGQGLTDMINSEIVALEAVRTIAGSVGLVAAIPFTTMFAAWATAGGRKPAQEHDDTHNNH